LHWQLLLRRAKKLPKTAVLEEEGNLQAARRSDMMTVVRGRASNPTVSISDLDKTAHYLETLDANRKRKSKKSKKISELPHVVSKSRCFQFKQQSGRTSRRKGGQVTSVSKAAGRPGEANEEEGKVTCTEREECVQGRPATEAQGRAFLVCCCYVSREGVCLLTLLEVSIPGFCFSVACKAAARVFATIRQIT
jgi:hypothetical protein